MANYNQISRGSGDKNTVLTLQRELNKYGAGLEEDGIFGAKTDAALRNYQRENGLQVDGIAGEKTWAKLMGNSNAGNQQPVQQQTATAPVAVEPEKSYRWDKENDPVYQAAKQKATDLEGSKPTIQGTFDEQYEQLIQEMLGQKNFEYDLNGDALWQQYKDQYTTQGKLAMMDTMGQAAALTGGYGSSFGQVAGQQAYQGEMQKLSDRVPELYQLALQKYNNDQAQLKDKLATVQAARDDEYSKDMDKLNLWYTDLGLAKDEEQTAYERGSSEWYTGEQLRRDDENTAYTKQQDAYSKVANMIATTGYVPSDAERAAAGMTEGEENALRNAYNQQVAAAYSDSGGNNESYHELSPKEAAEFRAALNAAKGTKEAEAIAADYERYYDAETIHEIYEDWLIE